MENKQFEQSWQTLQKEKVGKENDKKIIVVESYGDKIDGEEAEYRKSIIKELEIVKINRREHRDRINTAKEKLRKGELISSVEAGLLRAEEIIEEELSEDLLSPSILKNTENDMKSEEAPVNKEKEEEVILETSFKEDSGKEQKEQGEQKGQEARDEFVPLSIGQQKLVEENLRQLNFGRIKNEAEEKFKKNIREAGFLGRFWQEASRKYQIAKLEKEKAKEVAGIGLDLNGEMFKQLAKGMKEFGPDVEIKENGDLTINFISENEFDSLSPNQKRVLKNYNDVAARFSRLPEEQGFNTADKKDKGRYEELLTEYKKAQKNVLPILVESNNSDKAGLMRMNRADFGIKMNQFLTNNVEVEKNLEKIKDENVWKKVFKNTLTEKGVYMGAGYLAKTLAIGAMGVIGAPLAAAAVGGLVSNRRERANLKKNEMLARVGNEEKSSAAKNFVKADTLVANIDRNIRQINVENVSDGDKNKAQELKKTLALRIRYIKNKMDHGLVDYGEADSLISRTEEENEKSKRRDIVGNRYLLINKLSEAMIVSDQDNLLSENGETAKRLAGFIEFQKQRISKEERKRLIVQTLKGAGVAGGFALAGSLIRHFSEAWIEQKQSTPPLPIPPEETNTVLETEPVGVQAVAEKTILSDNAEDVVGVKAEAEIESVDINKEEPSGVEATVEKDVVISGETEKVSIIQPIENVKQNVRESISRFLNLEISDKDYEFVDGKHVINNFGHREFRLIVEEGDNGEIKFGVRGPARASRIFTGASGMTLGSEEKNFMVGTDDYFNKENLTKALDFVKKTAKMVGYRNK